FAHTKCLLFSQSSFLKVQPNKTPLSHVSPTQLGTACLGPEIATKTGSAAQGILGKYNQNNSFPPLPGKMARGQTWSEEEVKALIKIWADENVLQLLLTTHKNKQVFKLISGDMEALGFPRTASQCRTKVKKLRQQYVKIRNMLRNGSTGDAKDQKWISARIGMGFLKIGKQPENCNRCTPNQNSNSVCQKYIKQLVQHKG
uniref:Myb/SANT-like DNA-binding domain-containing protein n=1 Tax=Poecilia latipinna TaxID=48699 RepID=A0A3B3TZ40_9TELE